jgi:hypothetical protein
MHRRALNSLTCGVQDGPAPAGIITTPATESRVMRFALRQGALLRFTLACVLSAAAFLRGNYLLGTWWGTLSAAIALGLLWLFVRSLHLGGRLALLRLCFIGVFCLLAAFAMSFPASINPDMQVFINDQAVDRAARAELAAVFAADPSFSGLSVSSEHLRAVNVTVRGSFGTRADFDRLRARVIEECPAVRHCFLHWDLTISDPVQLINCEDDLDRVGP